MDGGGLVAICGLQGGRGVGGSEGKVEGLESLYEIVFRRGLMLGMGM